LSYAKSRILTRWATPDDERELLALAAERSAKRLTVAIARYLAHDETDAERDRRHHADRSVTIRTDADGMVVIRVALPPGLGKQVAAAVDALVHRVAATPFDACDAPADALPPPDVVKLNAECGEDASADAPSEPTMADRLRRLKQQWGPEDSDDSYIPSLAQQRADAFALLFLGKNVDVATEVIVHIRGDGASFDDGTPITESAVCRRLGHSFIRAMIHDIAGRPIDATNRRRHPTARQKRVAMEAHRNECIDCQGTDLLELDHRPAYEITGHTNSTELEPRCAPCHQARHQRELGRTPNRPQRLTAPVGA